MTADAGIKWWPGLYGLSADDWTFMVRFDNKTDAEWRALVMELTPAERGRLLALRRQVAVMAQAELDLAEAEHRAVATAMTSNEYRTIGDMLDGEGYLSYEAFLADRLGKAGDDR